MFFLLKKPKYNFDKSINGITSIENSNTNIIVCDREIYKMEYNMNTIKKRVPHLFIDPRQVCYYFSSVGITNLNLTTYNDFMHDQAKLLFKVLNVYETEGKVKYSVFAGNSIGLVRARKNLPWGDDYDIILFNNDIAFFTDYIIPELERIGFKIKIKMINGVICGVKIFGPPIIFNEGCGGDHNNHSISIFQCDVFYSYFDSNNILKNCGGWGLYHDKNIPHNIVFPLKRRMFHGILLPFFNNPLKEVEMCYGNINKCSIFSHHISSTIFYKKWEHAYNDFYYIKKISILNTKKYIACGGGTTPGPSSSLSLTCSQMDENIELSDIIYDNKNDNLISRKLKFLCYLYKNNIGEIIVTPLHYLKNSCNTNYKMDFFKDIKKIMDVPDYNYTSPGLKFIGEHGADIKYYFPQVKIIYDETGENNENNENNSIPLLHYKYIDALRINKSKYETIYQTQYNIATKYQIKMPALEII
jgi:hypothetical protein